MLGFQVKSKMQFEMNFDGKASFGVEVQKEFVPYEVSTTSYSWK